jgi:hypothetical protein
MEQSIAVRAYKEPSSVTCPFKFNNVTELQTECNAYFAHCDPHIGEITTLVTDKDTKEQVVKKVKIISQQRPYTISGLAEWLGTTRRTLLDYEQRFPESEITHTIKAAKAKCERYAEEQLFFGGNATGVIFNLKNNYSWVDRTEQINDMTEEMRDAIERARRALPD